MKNNLLFLFIFVSCASNAGVVSVRVVGTSRDTSVTGFEYEKVKREEALGMKCSEAFYILDQYEDTPMGYYDQCEALLDEDIPDKVVKACIMMNDYISEYEEGTCS